MPRTYQDIARDLAYIDFEAWKDLLARFNQCLHACAFQSTACINFCSRFYEPCLPECAPSGVYCIEGCGAQHDACIAQCSVLYNRELLELAAARGIDTTVDQGDREAALREFARRRLQKQTAARAGQEAFVVGAFGLGTAATISSFILPRVLPVGVRWAGAFGPSMAVMAAVFGLLAFVCNRMAADPPRSDFNRTTIVPLHPLVNTAAVPPDLVPVFEDLRHALLAGLALEATTTSLERFDGARLASATTELDRASMTQLEAVRSNCFTASSALKLLRGSAEVLDAEWQDVPAALASEQKPAARRISELWESNLADIEAALRQGTVLKPMQLRLIINASRALGGELIRRRPIPEQLIVPRVERIDRLSTALDGLAASALRLAVSVA